MEVYSIALWKLEHGEELGLRDAPELVVYKIGHDVGVGTASVVDQLNGVVGVAEAEATLDFHSKFACENKKTKLSKGLGTVKASPAFQELN